MYAQVLLAAVFFFAKLGRGCTGPCRLIGLSCCRRAIRRRWLRQTSVPADLFLPGKWDVGPLGETLRLDEDQHPNGLERFLMIRTCSAAARVLNVTTTSPLSS